MPPTIDKENKQKIRAPFLIDNFSESYKTESGLYTFTSPSVWVLKKHLYYLLRNSILKDFKTRYLMRPDYLSIDEYGTTALEDVLMYINNIPSAELFDLEKVYVPSVEAIAEICKDKYPKRDVENLLKVNF